MNVIRISNIYTIVGEWLHFEFEYYKVSRGGLIRAAADGGVVFVNSNIEPNKHAVWIAIYHTLGSKEIFQLIYATYFTCYEIVILFHFGVALKWLHNNPSPYSVHFSFGHDMTHRPFISCV